MSLSENLRRRLRGVILELVLDGHRNQLPRMEGLTLYGCLQELGFRETSLNDMYTELQDLRDRGYLKFEQKRDRRTGELWITLIEITPAGRDLVEKTAKEDPAVLIL